MNSTLLLLGFFLVGSIPFSYLAVRLRTGTDLRRSGSGNPGATNALRAAGPGVAIAGLILDISKGFVPIRIALAADLPDEVLAAGAVACVLGHVLSPFLGFRGGKGVATGFGALSALNPFAALLACAIFLLVIAMSRIVSLSSILAVTSLPLLWPLSERLGYSVPAGRMGWLAAAVICGLVLTRHGGNFKRLRSGTEARLGRRSI